MSNTRTKSLRQLEKEFLNNFLKALNDKKILNKAVTSGRLITSASNPNAIDIDEIFLENGRRNQTFIDKKSNIDNYQFDIDINEHKFDQKTLSNDLGIKSKNLSEKERLIIVAALVYAYSHLDVKSYKLQKASKGTTSLGEVVNTQDLLNNLFKNIGLNIIRVRPTVKEFDAPNTTWIKKDEPTSKTRERIEKQILKRFEKNESVEKAQLQKIIDLRKILENRRQKLYKKILVEIKKLDKGEQIAYMKLPENLKGQANDILDTDEKFKYYKRHGKFDLISILNSTNLESKLDFTHADVYVPKLKQVIELTNQLNEDVTYQARINAFANTFNTNDAKTIFLNRAEPADKIQSLKIRDTLRKVITFGLWKTDSKKDEAKIEKILNKPVGPR